MTRLLGAIAALTCAALTFTSPAAAYDRTYPGLRCVDAFEGPPQVANIAYDDTGAAENFNTAYRTVVCPINRRGDLLAGTFTGVWVWLRSPNYSAPPPLGFSCSLVSCDASGVCTSTTSSTSASNQVKLTFGDVTKYANGYAYITCSIPPHTSLATRRGAVLSYGWNE